MSDDTRNGRREEGAGNRRYAQDGENEARMNDVRSEGTVNRLPSPIA